MLLKDLSTTFDCLLNNFAMSKLKEYGFSMIELRLIGRWEVENNVIFTSWEVICRIAQRSILWHTVFNMFLCQLFFVLSDDEITSWSNHDTKQSFQNYGTYNRLFQWLYGNQIKTSREKYHLISASVNQTN